MGEVGEMDEGGQKGEVSNYKKNESEDVTCSRVKIAILKVLLHEI